MKLCIIGAGWYGCHLAKKLSKAGHIVHVFEKKSGIVEGISGCFGIRLHAGPHYPRSPKTRESCHRSYKRFINEYPELIVKHSYAHYGIGNSDADDLPSKVDVVHFAKVCKEAHFLEETYKPSKYGYLSLKYLANIEEPSIVVGSRLRLILEKQLNEHLIKFIYKTAVDRIESKNNKIKIYCRKKMLGCFDFVINTTSYKDIRLLTGQKGLPFAQKYQPCLALIYQEKITSQKKPFSFIVMDGLFPCVMPYLDDINEINCCSKYVLTHGKWTILGSFDTPDKAKYLLRSLEENDINYIKDKCEYEIAKYWPKFLNRFHYVGWKGKVLAKLYTNVEFRNAVIYQDVKNVIHVIPGKISNIFDVEDEVFQLINQSNVITSQCNGFRYIHRGVLDDAMQEIIEKPSLTDTRNTCQLQTYQEFKKILNEWPDKRTYS